IAIEQQAHGNTADRPGKPITIHQMVKDTAGVLVHLKVRQADLFGHSLGRIIATGMATRPRSRASFPMPASRCCRARRTSALSSATMARANDRDPHAAQLVSVIIERSKARRHSCILNELGTGTRTPVEPKLAFRW